MCRHRNVDIYKEVTARRIMIIEHGSRSLGEFELVDVHFRTGRYECHCYDCDKDFVFTESNMPKWLLEYIMLDCSDEDKAYLQQKYGYIWKEN